MLALLPLLCLPLLAAALSNDAMRQRRVYQVVTDRFASPTNSSSAPCNVASAPYCGGTYKGLMGKLDYIRNELTGQNMGFDTLWISPVVSNIGGTTGYGQAYHGYWTLDPAKLNDNFGTADDLKALSAAIHAKGMYLMVDIVVNHVAATSGSSFSPSSSYGAFSTAASFHPFCWITDYTNQTQVEQCWLGDDKVALPDLNTNDATVANYWNTWIKKLVSDYSIDLIRIDTVKHVAQSFWPGFLNAAGVGNVGEVLDGNPSYVAAYQKSAQINPFNYPIYYPLVRAFNGTSGNMTELINMAATVKSSFSDPTLLGGFLNNHDNPRFEAWVQDAALIKNAHAYSFVSDSVPYLYYGSEAGFKGGADPLNREPMWTTNFPTTSDLYKFFTALNAARSAAGNASTSFYTTQMTLTSLSAKDLLIAKGPLISVLTSRGASGAANSINIPQTSSGWGNSISVTDALTCTQFTTASNGALSVPIEGGMPRVLIETSKKGSLCTNATTTNTSSTGKSAADRTGGVDGLLALGMGAVAAVGGFMLL